MDEKRYRYEIRVPLDGATPEQLGLGSHYITVARADTPQGAGAVIAALCSAPTDTSDHIRVEIRREL